MGATHTPTPAELVQQWLPRLRRLAYKTGLDIEDIKQDAWMLAATVKPGKNFVPRWLEAVGRHALGQAPGKIIRPGEKKNKEFLGTAWLAGSGADDPAQVHEAAVTVADLLSGDRLDQVINLPGNTREMMQVTGKSESQSRRDLRRLEALAAVQGDFWGAPV